MRKKIIKKSRREKSKEVQAFPPQKLTHKHIAQLTEQLVETAPCGIALINQAGTIAWTNTRLQQMFGYPEKEINGQSVQQLLPKRFRTRHARHLKRYFSEPRHRSFRTGQDLIGVRRDGSEFPVEIRLSPVQTALGRGVAAWVTDMTPRKHEEMFLQLGHRIFENSPDHIAIVGKDYHYRQVNQTYVTAHNLTRSKIIGKHIAALLGSDIFSKTVKPHLDRCLAGEVVSYQSSFEFQGMGPRLMLVSYFPLQSQGVQVEAVVVASRDITDFKMLENTIQTIRGIIENQRTSKTTVGKHTIDNQFQDLNELRGAFMEALSSYEKTILSLIAQGKTNKEIASALKLSEKTVRNYLTILFRKLRITRRTEAATLFTHARAKRVGQLS